MTSEAKASDAAPPIVAAVVINSVSHDGRVIKEAESLTRAGYDVTIVGIRDQRDSRPENVLPSGVRIVRVDWQAVRDRYLMRFRLIGLVCAAVFGFAACALLAALTQAWTGLHWLAGAAVLLALAAAVGGAALLRLRAEKRRAQTTGTEHEGFVWRIVDGVYGVLKIVGRPMIHQPAVRDAFGAELRRINPAIVHGHDLSGLQVAVVYKQRHGGVLVYDSHELIEDVAGMQGLRRRAYQRRQRKCSAFVDRFITINDSIAETLRKRYPRLPEATIVMNATPREASPEPYDGRLHAAAGLGRSTRVLLYQGGFSPHRGLAQIVAAAPKLPAGWALVMMGWGKLEAELKGQAAEIDPRGEKVRFIPGAPLAELMRWTCGGDIGAIPYENVCLNHWFCTPNKLWEYPNAGVPILASPFPEMRKIVEGHDVGWLLDDPVTPGRIAEVIGSISDDELARKKANCRRFIEADNWSVYEERLVAMYRGIETTSVKP